MEKGSASVRNSLCNSRASLLPPKIPIPATSQSYAEYVGQDHRRTSSECLLIEKPSWFDELLDEPETPVRKGGHRRSSSDSFAYAVGNIVQSSGSAQSLPKADGIPSLASEGKEAAEAATHYSEGSAEKNDSSHGKPSPSETDTERAKRQFLRPRVRRRQYIAELEGDVQALEAETSGASAQLEFVKQQNLIIGMENIALKQRIESLAQEQLIKHLEQEALQREVARLRALYLQQQFQRFSHQRM